MWCNCTYLLMSRLTCSLAGVLQQFIREYFDQNPLSHLGILVLRNGVSERLTNLSGSPVRMDVMTLAGSACNVAYTLRSCRHAAALHAVSWRIASTCGCQFPARMRYLRDQNLRLLPHVSSVSIKHAKGMTCRGARPAAALWRACMGALAHNLPATKPG